MLLRRLCCHPHGVPPSPSFTRDWEENDQHPGSTQTGRRQTSISDVSLLPFLCHSQFPLASATRYCHLSPLKPARGSHVHRSVNASPLPRNLDSGHMESDRRSIPGHVVGCADGDRQTSGTEGTLGSTPSSQALRASQLLSGARPDSCLQTSHPSLALQSRPPWEPV